MGAPRGPLAYRLWLYVDRRGPDECWPWTKSVNQDGYAKIADDGGKKIGAHRAAYELCVGPIPGGLQLDHLCHVGTECEGGPSCPHRRCCNPRHLRPATHKQNIGRGTRAVQTRCKKGHDITDPANLKPNKRGVRQCRACVRAAERRRSLRRRRGIPPMKTGRPRIT